MKYCATSPTAAFEPARPQAPELILEGRQERTHQIAQALVLVILFAAPALMAMHAAAVGDPDIWWHLRAGEWIMQHRAVPHVDPFSTFAGGRPWAAYSWLFDLIAYHLFRHLGSAAIVAYTAGLLLAITVALHHLVRRLQGDFTVAALLTFAACFSFGHLYTPRPWLFSILFFVLEIDILMHARRTGRPRELAWLPVIFMVWANVHIQFIDGLVVLVLACAESIFARYQAGTSFQLGAIARPAIRLPWILLATFASVLGTLCNPYGWNIYQIAHSLAAQPGVLNKLQELQAIPFRDLCDWCILALALAAVAVLARARRFLPFEIALLAFSIFLAFRSQRDVWVLAIAAAAILAARLKVSRDAPHRVPPSLSIALATISALTILIGFPALSIDSARLNAHLASDLPVQAVQFVKAHQYSGPLYNDYGWGGYLIWELRLPVSIDGRAALYGDQRIDRSDATWSGQRDWASDPDLQSSGLVIGPVKAPLSQILRLDPRFQLVYEDKLAAVFTHYR